MSRFRSFLVLVAVLVGTQLAWPLQGKLQQPTDPKTRAHGGAYRDILHRAGQGTPTILDRPGDRLIGDESEMVLDGSGPRTADDQLTRSVCASDAVVVGRVLDKSSYLTEDSQFLLTDYGIRVSHVLKGAGIAPDSTITYVRPGGVLDVKGKAVRANHAAFPELQPQGEYVLFLDVLDPESYRVATGAKHSVDALTIESEKAASPNRGIGDLKTGVPLEYVMALAASARCSTR